MVAYVISETEVLDFEGIGVYAVAAEPTLRRYSARFLAQGQLPAAVEEGNWTEGHVATVIEFPSMQHAKEWYASEDYQNVKKLREGKANLRIIFVDGKLFDGSPAS